MKKQYVWIGILLVVVLVAIAYRYLPRGEQDSGMSAESELVVTANSETLANEQPAATERESDTGSAVAPDERPLERKSKTKGDRTHFSISDGDIGYVDVHSIMRDRNPYSIVDLLQTHGELTGADDSLEITIEEISENEIWGQGVFFRQFIRGQPTREVGAVFFSPDGTVTWMRGDLISTRSLDSGNILILQPEAEAIALDVAASYAANLEPENPEWSDVPVTLTARSTEMRYDLDSGSNLTALWRVTVGISGPVGTGVYVSISPHTGEVLRVDSALVRSTTTGHAFIVCDGAMAATEDGTWPTEKISKTARECDLDNSAGSPLLISVNGECQLVSESICQESVYTMPQATVDGVFAAVQAVSSRSIASPINIIVRYPGTGFSGDWDEDTSTIRITADNTDPYYTAVHEAFHAVSQSPHGQIEHGLVYGMSAIRTGRTGDWHYEGTSIASVDATYTPDGPAVANVVYRIYKKVGEEKAFKFVLDVDKQMPSTMNEAADAMQTIAKQMGISDDVNEALIAVPKGSDWMRQIYAGAISLGMTVEGLDGVLKVIVRDGGLENVEARFWKHMEPYLRERLNDMIAEQGFGERVGGKWDLEDWRLVPPSG